MCKAKKRNNSTIPDPWSLIGYDFASTIFSFIFAAQSKNGPVAQLNRASDYGSEGFRFES